MPQNDIRQFVGIRRSAFGSPKSYEKKGRRERRGVGAGISWRKKRPMQRCVTVSTPTGLDSPGPGQETYEMHLRTVSPGHKEDNFALPLPTPLAKGEFPRRLSGCVYRRAKWASLSDSCCGVTETLGQEARNKRHDTWQGPVRCMFVKLLETKV